MILGQRTFSMEDQQEFATASGDLNPMHLDALKARRTQAGEPVVHGIHILLWVLDAFAANQREIAPVRSLRAHFDRFLYLEEQVTIILTDKSERRARFQVRVGNVTRLRLTLDFGDPHGGTVDWNTDSMAEIPFSSVPMDQTFSKTGEMTGRIAFRMTDPESRFPSATAWLGSERIAVLAATTHLVGMICPGLHSIYSELSLQVCTEPAASPGLSFRVADADERFRSVQIDIAGADLVGSLETTARTPPVEQAGVAHLTELVEPGEFSGATALIVGGSRGLGELTAKLIALGGGNVIITWHSGKADAERVAAEIEQAGGLCDILQYDARKPATEQLAPLNPVPTHVYFYATPTIFKAASAFFSAQRFKEFLQIYIDGFIDLLNAVRERQSALSAFYPSSVAVGDRPQGMTEYSMAKAAGEVLCSDINTSLAPARVTVERLPRLLTDQTATVTGAETASAVDVMLPIIRRVQAKA